VLGGEEQVRVVTFQFTGPPPGEGNLDLNIAWVRTGSKDIYLSWDGLCETFKITSQAVDPVTGKATTVTSVVPKKRPYRCEWTIKGDYEATGNALPVGDEHASSTASLTTIPVGAEIKAAYLYWSASLDGSASAHPDIEAQLLQIDGNNVTGQDQKVPAQDWWILKEDGEDGNAFAYSCFKDVTSRVKNYLSSASSEEQHSFTVGGINGAPYTTGGLSYAGWSLIVIYSYSAPDQNCHQIYLYDPLMYATPGTSATYTNTGDEPNAFEDLNAANDGEVKFTCFVGGGDESEGDYISFTTDDTSETRTNPWNGTIDTIDIDTFGAEISNNTVTIEAGTTNGEGNDCWSWIYLIASFPSNEDAETSPFAMGITCYNIELG
jgi:hypothetical protein